MDRQGERGEGRGSLCPPYQELEERSSSLSSVRRNSRLSPDLGVLGVAGDLGVLGVAGDLGVLGVAGEGVGEREALVSLLRHQLQQATEGRYVGTAGQRQAK